MSDSSEHSAELAAQLRETALKNLGRSGGTYRSTISGQFVSGAAAARHPRSTTSETVSSGKSKTSRGAKTGKWLGGSRKV